MYTVITIVYWIGLYKYPDTWQGACALEHWLRLLWNTNQVKEASAAVYCHILLQILFKIFI